MPQPMTSASNTMVRISSLPGLLIGIRKTSRRGRKRDEAAEHRGLARSCFPVDAKCHLSVPAGCDVHVARGQRSVVGREVVDPTLALGFDRKHSRSCEFPNRAMTTSCAPSPITSGEAP